MYNIFDVHCIYVDQFHLKRQNALIIPATKGAFSLVSMSKGRAKNQVM